VLDGTIVLELDDGETVALHKGDVVIQNGTRHAWRNPTDAPATVAFFVVGRRARPLVPLVRTFGLERASDVQTPSER